MDYRADTEADLEAGQCNMKDFIDVLYDNLTFDLSSSSTEDITNKAIVDA